MASKNIQFKSIPDGIKVRGIYVEQDITLANHSLPSGARRIMVIGQRTNSGSIAQKVAKQCFSGLEAAGYWGNGSMIALMIDAILKKNPYVEVWGVALDDNAGGVAATGTFTITGPSTASGSIRAFIGDQYVDVAIANAATPTDVAAAMKAAINAKVDFPVTADNVAGVLTVTSKFKGLCANDIPLSAELTAATGIACAVVQMAAGATNPSVQDALDIVAGARYHIIVTPFNNQADLTTLKTHIDTVSGWNNPRACIGVYATNGVLATTTTLAGQVNSERIVNPYVRYTTATKRREPSWIAAAIAAADEAARKLSDPVIDRDLSNIPVPDVADRFVYTEEQSCLTNGVAPITIGAGETPTLKRMPTTKSKDANNQAVLIDLHKITAMDYARDALIADLAAKAPKKIKRTPPATKDVIKSIALDVAFRCQEAGILDNVADYKDLFLVEEDLQNAGQINISMPSPVGDGAYVLAVKQVLY